MKVTKKQLQKIIKEELGTVLSLGPVPISVEAEMIDSVSPMQEQMMGLLACLHTAQVWFHSAHLLTKGTGFAGDHVNIYGDIYTALLEDYDGAAEKAIGLTGDEGVACPHAIMAMSMEKLDKYRSPSDASAAAIADCALEIMHDLNDHVEEVFSSLESSGQLALGLNDFLAAAANDYTKYIYLLQQRTRE